MIADLKVGDIILDYTHKAHEYMGEIRRVVEVNVNALVVETIRDALVFGTLGEVLAEAEASGYEDEKCDKFGVRTVYTIGFSSEINYVKVVE